MVDAGGGLVTIRNQRNANPAASDLCLGTLATRAGDPTALAMRTCGTANFTQVWKIELYGTAPYTQA